jgi:BlaI family penicillinase repressor
MPELTEVEWEIMRVVWEKQPCTAGTVQEALADAKGWAYSTVKTTMDRMLKKGVLEMERLRNLQLFRSRIEPIDARRGEFRKMLKRAFNGGIGPMMQFLIEDETISKKELDQLRRLIDRAETNASERG